MNKENYKNLPDSPGVYLMKDAAGRVLYVGKAGNLRRRASSYFERPHDARIQKLVSEIEKIDYRQTDTALEALILEFRLIKKFSPPFNIREKDDKSFLYAEITRETFPRVLLVRGKDKISGSRFGPFTSASDVREALKILRRIFPWSGHDPARVGKFAKPCFDYEIGLCPGTCVGAISKTDYRKNIAKLKLFFEGKKQIIIRGLQKEMAGASRKLDFEKAAKLRRQIFALGHIRDMALINEPEIENYNLKIGNSARRIEGYDISNISGVFAVGSMVVFANGEPDKGEYRKFKIRTIRQADDVGMLKEVLRRRFSRAAPAGAARKGGWPLPDIILIDGGRGQVNAAKSVLAEAGLKIPVVGIAKGAKRKKNEFIGNIPADTGRAILIKVRDEAHRFAIGYHRRLRSRQFFIDASTENTAVLRR